MSFAAAPEVPGFHALSPLGTGPSSAIFSAQSEELGRWVALTIYTSASPSARDPERFQRAFEVSRRLGVHPHAVTLLGWGSTPDGKPYVVTEFYEHGTFDTRISGHQPLPVDKTLRIGIALAGALETAHRVDVVHGGVHPARVLADSDDEPSLADTGLVPLVDRLGTDALVGPTNYHAPPEVLEGEELTPASDVYSLASTLHTLLATRPPYWRPDEDDTSAALLLRILRHEVTPLERQDVPPTLQEVLHAALHSHPRQRPASIVAFAQALQQAQQEIGAPITQPVLLDVKAGLGDPGTPTGGSAGSVALDAPVPAPGSHPDPPAGPGAPPPPVPEPGPGPTPFQQVFVPYPVPEPEVDPWFGPPDPPFPDEPPAGPAPEAPVPAPETVPHSPDPDGPFAEAAASNGRSLHEQLSTSNPWPPQPEVPQPEVPNAARPVARGEEAAVAVAEPEAGEVAAPPVQSSTVRRSDAPSPDGQAAVRGPRALPVIVLGVIVGLLFVAAAWTVATGSGTSEKGVTDPVSNQVDR